MSDYLEDDDDETPNDSKLVKDLRRQIKDLSKRAEESERTATELKGTVRKRTLEEVLTSKGVNLKVANFIPSDVEGDEGVTKWLDEYGDVFGIKQVDDTTPEGMSPEDVAAARQIQAASTGNLTPDKFREQETAMRNATSKEELDAVIRQYS